MIIHDVSGDVEIDVDPAGGLATVFAVQKGHGTDRVRIRFALDEDAVHALREALTPPLAPPSPIMPPVPAPPKLTALPRPVPRPAPPRTATPTIDAPTDPNGLALIESGAPVARPDWFHDFPYALYSMRSHVVLHTTECEMPDGRARVLKANGAASWVRKTHVPVAFCPTCQPMGEQTEEATRLAGRTPMDRLPVADLMRIVQMIDPDAEVDAPPVTPGLGSL